MTANELTAEQYRELLKLAERLAEKAEVPKWRDHPVEPRRAVQEKITAGLLPSAEDLLIAMRHWARRMPANGFTDDVMPNPTPIRWSLVRKGQPHSPTPLALMMHVPQALRLYLALHTRRSTKTSAAVWARLLCLPGDAGRQRITRARRHLAENRLIVPDPDRAGVYILTNEDDLESPWRLRRKLRRKAAGFVCPGGCGPTAGWRYSRIRP